jgi:hypothetical protein
MRTGSTVHVLALGLSLLQKCPLLSWHSGFWAIERGFQGCSQPSVSRRQNVLGGIFMTFYLVLQSPLLLTNLYVPIVLHYHGAQQQTSFLPLFSLLSPVSGSQYSTFKFYMIHFLNSTYEWDPNVLFNFSLFSNWFCCLGIFQACSFLFFLYNTNI